MGTKISTDKLVLKPVELSDLQDMYYLRTNPQVAKYIERDVNKNLEEIKQFIELVRKNNFYFTINTIAPSEFIGTITLWNIDRSTNYAEIGYELLPQFQGKGLMSEAVKAILDYAFNEAGFEYIEAYTHRENITSKKLLERVGFKLVVGKIDEDNSDIIIYGINKIEKEDSIDHE
ncbi:GNAT family N-acetyltransferase [Sphingobacterium sp. BIGb0165]|uniref:GNAT family N-acetyltransferase n=1 Tax=Sphingobacterium sp. BIGb0165 TaxID=2940615 RepID=UPI002166DEC6|nr:GNAT family N-acetyltransferase [Sphingobacterium sp. BIGb0165]MCS4228840.1 ribosomal-protein-alanine N-acetyltransferase [Sphingobacterium sp. BIGb0165]